WRGGRACCKLFASMGDSSEPATVETGVTERANGVTGPGSRPYPPASGVKAELARQFVATLGRIDNPTLLLVALPRAESFIPAGPNGLALLHEFAGRPE